MYSGRPDFSNYKRSEVRKEYRWESYMLAADAEWFFPTFAAWVPASVSDVAFR